MFDRIKSFFKSEAKSLAHPSPELLALFGASPTISGATVSAESAMRCSTVYGSVKVIAESVAQLPLHLYRRASDGGKERASDHPLAALLNDQANDWTSAFEFRMFMQSALLLHGNAFAFINCSGAEIVELIPIPSTAVVVDVDSVTMEPGFKVTTSDGAQRVYGRTEILHLKTLGTSPHVGLSPITQMREAIGLALVMEAHAARIFAEGARPSGVFEYSKMLGYDAVEQLRDSLSRHGGPGSGRTMVLEDGMTFKPVQFTSVDMQFLELRRHQVAEIARGFRIPLHLLQDLERTTHANAESMGNSSSASRSCPG